MKGDRELVARLSAMPEALRRALVRKVTTLGYKLEAKVKGKLSGDVLKVRTGALRRSIFFAMAESTSDAVKGKVASSGDVRYAAIHEFGGRTPPHIIEPVKAKVLAFMVGGKQVFARRVNHPGSQMPQRSFLRSSLADMSGEISVGLKDAIREGLRQK